MWEAIKGFFSNYSKWVKILMVLLLGLAILAQFPHVQQWLWPWLDSHPKLAPIVWTLITIGFLLMNPRVQGHIERHFGINLGTTQKQIEDAKDHIEQARKDLMEAQAKANEALNLAKEAAALMTKKE